MCSGPPSARLAAVNTSRQDGENENEQETAKGVIFMAWQNQPSSLSNPWPANAPYPGQPGPQFPSQPDVSPGGYPGQPISELAAPIPHEVSQAAERAELGAPTREYNRGAGNSSVTNVLGGVGGLIGIIGGVVGLLVGVLVPLMVWAGLYAGWAGLCHP